MSYFATVLCIFSWDSHLLNSQTVWCLLAPPLLSIVAVPVGVGGLPGPSSRILPGVGG